MGGKSLHQFVEEVSGDDHLRVEQDFGDGFVRLKTSEAERRQAAQDIRCSEDILIELLRNSRDAHATHIFVASSKEGNRRTMTVIDNGSGIPQHMHQHVFEPRVTSKLDTSHMDAWGLHGRGMALYSISANAYSAEVCSSDESLGCSLRVKSDTLKLPEKKDQSSFPTFTLSEENVVQVRGPKNLLRVACEFAIESRDSCSVYIGSPAEIAASLLAYGTSTLSSIDRVFCKDASELPVVKRAATASDPAELADICMTLGIALSERTARRIMNSEISQAKPLLDRISIQGADIVKDAAKPSMRTSPKAPVRLEDEDKSLLAESVITAFEDIALRFYLEPEIKPSVSVRKDKISITIPLVTKP